MRQAFALVAILLAPTLAGCLGGSDEERRLAQPTDKLPLPPTRATPRTPTTSYNFTDPGYRMSGPWRAGDGWDYESNHSHYRRVRVIDARLVSGTTMYYVEEKTGDVGEPPSRVVNMWIDGSQWTILNSTDDIGGFDRYQPGKPIRFFRNASFGFNHTRTESSGRVSANETVTVQTRLAGSHQSILFPWGYVEARRLEDTPTVRGASNATPKATLRWLHTDYLNDVQYQLPDGETYKLVAAKAGDFRRGKLVT